MKNFQLCENYPEYVKIESMDVFYTKHAIQRMFERNIDEDEVIEAIENGRIISEYPDDKPYPSILANSRIPGKPLHVVYSEDRGKRIVVTVYRPTLNEWNEDFSERRTNK